MVSVVNYYNQKIHFEKFLAIFSDHFEEGLRYVQENNLNGAEESLAQALKILSASPNRSLFKEEEATCFHTMAEVYSARASQHSDDDSFCEMMAKSIALFEAERIYKYGSYKEDKEVEAAISEAELKFIDKVFGPTGVERFEKMTNNTKLYREKLEKIRSKVSDEYFPRLDKFPDWTSKDEDKRCEEIESIYKEIHTELKCFLDDIFRCCSQTAGPAPCTFSIIGLGSISRKEVTPYSDLEFAILLDNGNKSPSPEQRQYFRFLTYLIQVQIIQLGETILPSVGISSLNDFYSKSMEDDWFFDDVIPKGFSFDGMMPWACKTPLGRKEWRGLPRQEYIMNIDEMLELQNVIPDSSFENAKTANVFSCVCHLFGEEKLTNAYEQRLSTLLSHGDKQKRFQEQVLGIMENLQETYGKEAINTKDFRTQQDVKKEIYRLTSLLVEQLSKFCGIFEQSSWQSIREMNHKGIISDVACRNLLVAVSITTELRLRCYQKQGRQKEALPTIPQLSLTEENDNQWPLTEAIVRLYQSLFPLRSVVLAIIEAIKEHDCIDPDQLIVSVMRQVSFFDVSSKTRAIAYLRILQLPKAFRCLLSAKDEEVDDEYKAEILVILAFCYKMVGKFKEAVDCCHEVQALYSAEPHALEERYLFNALTSVFDAYIGLGLYVEAMNVYQQLMDFQDRRDFEIDYHQQWDIFHASAVLFTKISQYNKAESILRSVIDKFPNKRMDYYHYFICLNNLSVILLNENRLEEAKDILNSALEVASKLYGEKAVHPHFARCLVNLSEVYYSLKNIEEADRVAQFVLTMCSHFGGEELIDPCIIDALIMKARIYKYYEQWDQMFHSLKKANDFAGMLYRGQPHTNVSDILCLLGYCEERRGNVTEALNHYQKFLKIYEKERMESQQCDDSCTIAGVLLHIAYFGEKCLYDPSHLGSYFEKALDIEEKVHGKGSNHAHLAACFELLGYHSIAANRETKGLEYLDKALRIFEELSFHNKPFYGHALLKVGELLGEYSPTEAEEHLRKAKVVLNNASADESTFTLLKINSYLLRIFQQTNRIQDGLEVAKEQSRLIDSMLSNGTVPSFLDLCHVFKLAEFYEWSGRRNTAKAMYFDVITRTQEQIDSTDSSKGDLLFLLLLTQERVGDIYRVDEMFSNAEAMYQRMTMSAKNTMLQQSFVKQAHESAICRLAAVYIQTGRHSKALELLDNLIDTYDKDPKLTDDNTASCALLLRGELYRRCCRFDLALVDLERASKIAEQTAYDVAIGTNRAHIMNTIGLVYEQTNELERALEHFRCSLSVVEGMPSTLETAIFHHNAADILKKLRQFDEALVHYKKSLKIRELLHLEDPVREDIATVLYHMAVTQYLNNRSEEASETLEKLLPLRKKLGGPLQNYIAALVLKGNVDLLHPDKVQQAKEAYEEAEKLLNRMMEGQPNADYAGIIGNIGKYE